MKPILLLAAIYSLIIHQTHKNATEKIKPAETNKAFNVALSPILPANRPLASYTVKYGNGGFETGTFTRLRWTAKD